ncbi:hypothetical protein HY489_03270 [Candidatus Woesearchaeota archaeon]|nr:hypothetical protein [Candidatus Woesearchaeota archaeon]
MWRRLFEEDVEQGFFGYFFGFSRSAHVEQHLYLPGVLFLDGWSESDRLVVEPQLGVPLSRRGRLEEIATSYEAAHGGFISSRVFPGIGGGATCCTRRGWFSRC